jgi:hypothetical protein
VKTLRPLGLVGYNSSSGPRASFPKGAPARSLIKCALVVLAFPFCICPARPLLTLQHWQLAVVWWGLRTMVLGYPKAVTYPSHRSPFTGRGSL